MIEKWKTSIVPLSKRPRTVYVYVPDEAADDPDARFPVLYMFDGHNVFFDSDATYGKCWGMKEYMEQTETPVIIVGVDCNHSPRNGRLSEYSPYTFDDERFGHIKGRGRKYMDWLIGTLKPLIDERYPTIPDREATWIAGSSMGGLMTLYAVTAHNDVFSRAAALSPSVWVDPKKLNKLFREAPMASDTVIYMDYGSRELANHQQMRTLFTQAAATLMERDVNVNARIVPGGEHCEACWEEQIPFFMNTLLYERE